MIPPSKGASMPLLQGKTGVVFGVANKRSIAWAIAQALSREGMRLAFTYQGERLKANVEELCAAMPDSLILPCDVTSDAEIDAVFKDVGDKFGGLDALVHSVAFAPREDLENDFVNTSREGFKTAHDISAYSLVGLTRAAMPLFEKNGGGAVLALTYYGAEKAVEGYNLMGVAKASLEASIRYLAANLGPKNVRVNAISAGPVNTLAARGIKGFTGMLKHHAERAPLRRNVELEEIANAALFLISSMSAGITGEVLFVDGGYNIVGL
ncbi:MAG: enoyl-[acyl-carrier protein] reductase [Thermoanaerobaculia bacterium]|nr:enoyl-[acyl-carrier protein] reductase [Thermoanaerobaculia bacterium]